MSMAIKHGRSISVLILILLSGIAFLGYSNYRGNAENLQLDANTSEIHLMIDNIAGYSQSVYGIGEHDLLAVSVGVIQDGSSFSGQTRHRGRATFSDISILKTVDASSSKFMISVASGDIFLTAKISFYSTSRDGRSNEYLRYELIDVLLTSYQMNTNVIGTSTESITLSFSEITVTSWEQNVDGSRGPPHEESWIVDNGK